MSRKPNPYQTPEDGDSDQSELQPFQKWNDRRMVALFFLPSIAFAGIIILLVTNRHFGVLGQFLSWGSLGFMTIFAVLALVVSVFSAHINRCRQQSSRGSFILMIFVYLIAQVFALFLTIAVIVVIGQIL
jgi:hypothetical protein|tara:strand:+ start:11382 stop:11771 length:390 start_codon:yes stop_codon:yes gene_type:complete